MAKFACTYRHGHISGGETHVVVVEASSDAEARLAYYNRKDASSQDFLLSIELLQEETPAEPSVWETPIGKDCIDLGRTASMWLGSRLKFLAKHTHGHPVMFDFECWKGHLDKHGDALIAYANHSDDLTEPAVRAQAQLAMVFVANFLPNLWD